MVAGQEDAGVEDEAAGGQAWVEQLS